MTKTDIQIAICGSAGDGTIAAGGILRNALAKSGFKIIAFDVYPPEIRGFGKCISRIRATTEQSYSLKQQSDVLISLNDDHAIPHVSEVRDYGSVIFEDTPISEIKEGAHITSHISAAQLPYGLPVREISEQTTSSNRSRNIVILGYFAGLYSLPAEGFHETIAEKFKTKPSIVTTSNIDAFDAGYKIGASAFKLDDVLFGKPSGKASDSVTIMNGNAAIAKGAVDAKIDTFFGYPITPATSIMEKLAVEMPKYGGRFLQTEDEISALSAVIGAGFAGSRSATSTSGPGLALMAEMMGLGVMGEIPSVIFVSQRGGPSTGMPTKTEQSDLNLSIYGGSGDAPRIVLAPTNVEGCYVCAGKAFEMSEKYQTPVIVLIDLYISNRFETVTLPKKSPFDPDMSLVAHKPEQDIYSRFKHTDDNISPRTIPGQSGGTHVVTGLEHNERGRPSSEKKIHGAMSAKRHNKLEGALKHSGITISKRFGDEGHVDIGIIGWGSTFGECLEAMIRARDEGIKCAAFKVVMVSPLPADDISAFMDDCDDVLMPELNYEGQFANVVQGRLGRKVHKLDMVTGEPMQVEEILAKIKALSSKKVKKSKVA